ncbi:YigZ family protein [Trueperella bialowiezensis]|uniref:IMPACT family member yigZ n=1 Tax=Trueperella bialowiezensis TaxID=312285 RepID=A0A448PCS6_9ACTO|nr:YigZ family protein [Trueperella bialowiezensis]VEI12727.1 IMPACT family member yigZ [Trueperella bialowiezensis]
MTDLRLRTRKELRAEIEIKRSRFIAIARRVSSVEEARAVLADARAEFPDARHHCSAYVVSQRDTHAVLNSSDDGEPSGTAGRPMLDVLTGHNMTDVSVVVVRYFGGTLLGTGGLVRAYSDSVRAVLSDARLVKQEVYRKQRITARHALAGKVEAELRGRGYEVVDVNYGVTTVEIDVAVADPEAFAAEVAQLSAGGAAPLDVGTVIHEVPAGKFPTW